MPSSDRRGTNVPVVVSPAERPSQREQRSEAPTKQLGPYRADSEVIPFLKPGIEIALSHDCLPFLDLNAMEPEDQLWSLSSCAHSASLWSLPLACWQSPSLSRPKPPEALVVQAQQKLKRIPAKLVTATPMGTWTAPAGAISAGPKIETSASLRRTASKH